MIPGDAQRLEERIRKARARASSPDLTDEDRAWLGEMAAVWASGYLEAAFRDTLKQYVATRADTRVQQAMNRRLERFRNPRLGVILGLVGEFDTAWEDELRSLADGAVGESVNSIVALRHRIAHGRSDRVSIGIVGRYFDEARRLPRRLSNCAACRLGLESGAWLRTATRRRPRREAGPSWGVFGMCSSGWGSAARRPLVNAERTTAGHSSGGSSGETPLERRRRLLREVTEDFKGRGVGLDMAENLPRSELYDRNRARTEAAEARDRCNGPERA